MGGRVRMVKGPAKVVVQGTCHVLGTDVSWRTVRVRRGKALPFEPAQQCRLRVRLGRGGSQWWADPRSAGVSMWRNISQVMLGLLRARKSLVVMVVGDTDTGKSTLCAYLANKALASGFTPCVIDGDIGQGGLAPPSVIGAAVLTKQVTDLRDVSARLFEFVGSISPAGVEHLVSEKLSSIYKRSSHEALSIINTDGYVNDGGISYKSMIAYSLWPELIVCLGNNQALIDELARGPWQLLQAMSSSQAYKSLLERSWRRRNQFHRFIGRGLHRLDLSNIKFVYHDRTYSSSDIPKPPIQQLELKNMFVGLGSSIEITGFGIIENISPATILIRTGIEDFGFVYLSSIRLLGSRAEQITQP